MSKVTASFDFLFKVSKILNFFSYFFYCFFLHNLVSEFFIKAVSVGSKCLYPPSHTYIDDGERRRNHILDNWKCGLDVAI